jgi:hypothetical protein
MADQYMSLRESQTKDFSSFMLGDGEGQGGRARNGWGRARNGWERGQVSEGFSLPPTESLEENTCPRHQIKRE